jgi:hypothetical protein
MKRAPGVDYIYNNDLSEEIECPKEQYRISVEVKSLNPDLSEKESVRGLVSWPVISSYEDLESALKDFVRQVLAEYPKTQRKRI